MIYAISKEINIYKTIEKLFDLTVIDLVKVRKKMSNGFNDMRTHI